MVLIHRLQISLLSHQFPSLTSLFASTNQISSISAPLSDTIKNLTLENNEIKSFSAVRHLVSLPNLEYLSLRGNDIHSVLASDTVQQDLSFQFSSTVRSLDISRNKVNSWNLIDSLPRLFPGLKTLRISDNPLYDQPVAPSNVTNLPEKPMTVEEAFMLTLARLRNVESMNYSKITRQERTNGELYYLSLIGKELSAYPEGEEKRILASHPRYSELCELYGELVIRRAEYSSRGDVNPRSVAARLVKFTFYIPATSSSQPPAADSDTSKKREHIQEIPRTFDVYRMKAIVSRLFGLTPLSFRLIWETDEWDPVDEADTGLDEWDSSDEETDVAESENQKIKKEQTVSDRFMTREDGNKLVKREVELVDSTRQVEYWFNDDLREATVRVEVF